MSHININKFPGGEIHVAVAHLNGMAVHAYRFYRAHLNDEQWWAPIKGSAEAAVKLAYGREKIGGRYKTAGEVWNDMLPYLEPIPQLTEPEQPSQESKD